VRGLIHPAQVAALRRYYRELVAEGHVGQSDRQVPLRFAAHNEPLSSLFHRALAGLVGELAGERVKPSYVFFAAYQPGAVLEPHRDRDQCAISISLLLDYQPDPEADSPWPLHLGLDQGRRAAIRLGLGDGLFYRGTELVHWRDALPEGHASTSLFLHYVPESFEGSLE
jgi:alkylated DNA repair dioxygenase AlkB